MVLGRTVAEIFHYLLCLQVIVINKRIIIYQTLIFLVCFLSDLEPKMKNYHKLKPKTHRNTISELKYLKFVLVNLLSNIQHYVFSFVFTKCLQNFETNFEKAYDLSSITASHSEFIANMSLMTRDIRNSDNEVPPFDTVSIPEVYITL